MTPGRHTLRLSLTRSSNSSGSSSGTLSQSSSLWNCPGGTVRRAWEGVSCGSSIRSLALAQGRVASSRRPGCPGRLSRNRTSAVHIRLLGMPGYYPRHRPGLDLAVFQCQHIRCTGAIMSDPNWATHSRRQDLLVLALRLRHRVRRSPSLVTSRSDDDTSILRCRSFSCLEAPGELPCLFVDRDRLPSPEVLTPRVGTAFRPPSGTARSSFLCRAIGFRPCVLRPTTVFRPRSETVGLLLAVSAVSSFVPV